MTGGRQVDKLFGALLSRAVGEGRLHIGLKQGRQMCEGVWEPDYYVLQARAFGFVITLAEIDKIEARKLGAVA
jgi:hypothetical protein